MKTLVCFLNYDPEEKNKEMSDESRASLGVDVFEIKNVKGFVNAVNEGLKQDADYYIFVANDVVMEDPHWLDKMQEPDALVGWRMTPFFLNGKLFPDFACFGLSRHVRDIVGLMDTVFADGYGFDDNDYSNRVAAEGFALIDAGVKLRHLENKTYAQYFSAEKDAMTTRNQSIYLEKWPL